MPYNTQYLALRPEWVLRNEAYMVILYLMSNDELSYLILDPVSAAIVPFLDGQHTATEIAGALRFVFDLPSMESAESLLDSTVEQLNMSRNRVAVLDRPATWRVDYDPLDFIIAPTDFAPKRRLSRPLALLILFSGWCQTNCRYCYADVTHMRQLKHLSLDNWVPILQEARDLGIQMIQLSGGDPLGRRESIQFVRMLLQHRFLFMISTKCYVSAEAAMLLASGGFTEPVNGIRREFQISLDSPRPEIAAFLTGSRGYLERATQSVQNLIRANIPVRVKAVLTPYNCNHVREQIDTFVELGVRNFQFAVYERTYYRHDDSLLLSDEMKRSTADALSQLIDEHPEISVRGDATRFAPQAGNRDNAREMLWARRASCSGGRTVLGIAPDGKTVLCEQTPVASPFFVGDVTKQSIQDIWNSCELSDFIYPSRKQFANTPCFDCTDFDECIHNMGHCFRDAYFAYGSLHRPPPNCPKAAGSLEPRPVIKKESSAVDR